MNITNNTNKDERKVLARKSRQRLEKLHKQRRNDNEQNQEQQQVYSRGPQGIKTSIDELRVNTYESLTTYNKKDQNKKIIISPIVHHNSPLRSGDFEPLSPKKIIDRPINRLVNQLYDIPSYRRIQYDVQSNANGISLHRNGTILSVADKRLTILRISPPPIFQKYSGRTWKATYHKPGLEILNLPSRSSIRGNLAKYVIFCFIYFYLLFCCCGYCFRLFLYSS